MGRIHFCLLMVICGFAPTIVSAAETSLDGQIFTLPDGFEIEVIAKPPLVNRPVTGAFDEQGRFYVADSSGSNDEVERQLAQRPHRILRLEDSNRGGRFDRSTVFADKMMFPEGTMWLGGISLCFCSAQHLETDGYERRRSCRSAAGMAQAHVDALRNDLHGPYAGPDGWIYWCKGAFANQTYQLPGQKPVRSSAAHIFRARRTDPESNRSCRAVWTIPLKSSSRRVANASSPRRFWCTRLMGSTTA